MSTQENNSLDLIALDQASDWLVSLHSGEFTDKDRNAFELWLNASPQNAQAWTKSEVLMNKLGTLPPSLSSPVLNRPVNSSRRAALNKLAVLLCMTPIGWGSWRFVNSQGWTAEHQTARGEQREIKLADGSRLILNTDTAINISFDNTQRLITLIKGEVIIQTAKEYRTVSRPFYIETSQGRMEALGTRFNVRKQSGLTSIAVVEGAVSIKPKQAKAIVLAADQQTRFSTRRISEPQIIQIDKLAWTKGMLMADNISLADFISELSRYQNGIIRYQPALADLRISGAYPLKDIKQSLNMLVATYPISLNSHAGGYWITLSAK
ncbi:MAG: histidine kinase [Gammaproteobacteria bacterium]|nr:MAG: histidine kinase [Gammaproteobacteria bacterium]